MSWLAEAAELEVLELELELAVAVLLLLLSSSSSSDEDVEVDEDEDEVLVAVELVKPLTPALPVAVTPVAPEAGPVAAMVDCTKVDWVATPPVAEAPTPWPPLTPPWARADRGEAASRARRESCLKPNILARVVELLELEISESG